MADERSHPEAAFDSAIELLDQGQGEKAEALLTLVAAAARQSGESMLLVRALCVHGEWLREHGRTTEAQALMSELLSVQLDEPERIAYERRRARRILDVEQD